MIILDKVFLLFFLETEILNRFSDWDRKPFASLRFSNHELSAKLKKFVKLVFDRIRIDRINMYRIRIDRINS